MEEFKLRHYLLLGLDLDVMTPRTARNQFIAKYRELTE